MFSPTQVDSLRCLQTLLPCSRNVVVLHRLSSQSSSSDSDSSLPRTKVVATSSTIKILSDIKSLMGDYHTEAVRLRLERELDEKKLSVFLFSCLICKEIVFEESSPVVPPCCRASVVCCDWKISHPVHIAGSLLRLKIVPNCPFLGHYSIFFRNMGSTDLVSASTNFSHHNQHDLNFVEIKNHCDSDYG